ncbi:MAG: ATP-binding protein [Alphaproteobacteria bacterium]
MTEATAATSPSITGERRTLTVLFCDVVNSTVLAEKLDPEDWAETMNEAFRRLTDPIHRYEGTVAKLMGDGMLAFFGSPVAHEDDPQRAILASLDMIEAVRDFAKSIQRDHGFEFKVRIGIHTGPVVVAEIGAAGAREHTAMGEAVHIAARMEHAAEPGTIQISGDTFDLVAPLFDAEALGAIELKGISDPVPAYRVIGLKPKPGRLRGIDGISAPLVGRDKELETLKQVVDKVKNGRGQIVCLSGEAGLGKSRLLAEIAEYWAQQNGTESWHIMYGIPYDSSRPFGLFQNYARNMFGIDLDDPADTIHAKVLQRVRASGVGNDAVALCSVAFEHVIAAKPLHEAPEFPAEELKKDIYLQMYPGLHATALGAPTVIVADDLQWADTASTDLMMHLMELTEEVPILFLFAFRPERQSPAWQVKQKAETDYPHRYTEIALTPLDEGDTDTLISSLLNVTNLPPELHRLILRKTDGNPYFVEEVVRSLVDQGIVHQTADGLQWDETKDIESVKIPDSLHALLMARIDRLDQEAKSTLQMASVIGRSFYFRILEAISDSGIAVDRHLSSLERVELLREAGRNPELEYIFKHELARDAAYATILNRKRAEFHLRVAEAIESLFPDRLEENAHRLAQHFKLGGDRERALKYFEMAANVADRIDAKEEGVEHYKSALEVARELDDSEDLVARLSQKLGSVQQPAT